MAMALERVEHGQGHQTAMTVSKKRNPRPTWPRCNLCRLHQFCITICYTPFSQGSAAAPRKGTASAGSPITRPPSTPEGDHTTYGGEQMQVKHWLVTTGLLAALVLGALLAPGARAQ